MISSVSEQIKNFLTAHKHFYFLNGKSKTEDSWGAIRFSDENYNDDRDENRAGIDSSNINASKQLLLETIVMKMSANKLNAKNKNAKMVKRCQA